MNNRILIILVFLGSIFTYTDAQEKRDIAYLPFHKDSLVKCEIEDGDGNLLNPSKYRKLSIQNISFFYICDELFKLKSKKRIDTSSVNSINNIKYWTLDEMNAKRDSLKNTYFFKKDVFKEIYLIEPYEDKVIVYPVIWYTDLVMMN